MNPLKILSEVKGKTLVFGGVYSNLQALEKIQQIAEEERIANSNIFCTGDIVGYCAQPEECLQVIRDWDIHSIAGNVELQLRDDDDTCGCNFEEGTRCDVLSRNWYPYAQQNISTEMKEWLHSLPEFVKFNYAGKEVTMLHGGLHNTSQFIFRSTDWEIKKEIFLETNTEVVLAGHCGLPFNHIQENKHWLNAGVIGMPANDGTSRIWYLILEDTDGFTFQHKSFEYDNNKAADLMMEKKLPESYAQTLLNGIWDNCEVLPDIETQLQGIPIKL